MNTDMDKESMNQVRTFQSLTHLEGVWMQKVEERQQNDVNLHQAVCQRNTQTT
jgi:hypothetical protein